MRNITLPTIDQIPDIVDIYSTHNTHSIKAGRVIGIKLTQFSFHKTKKPIKF